MVARLNRLVKNSGPGKKDVPQGLKPNVFSFRMARLKSCPDTKPSFSAACEAVPFVRRLSQPQGSVRASCAFPNGQLTNLPWTSLNSVAVTFGGRLSLLRGLSKLVR